MRYSADAGRGRHEATFVEKLVELARLKVLRSLTRRRPDDGRTDSIRLCMPPPHPPVPAFFNSGCSLLGTCSVVHAISRAYR